MTAKAPLELDWNVLLPRKDDAPPPELQVVASGGGEAADADTWSLENLTDRQIEEKLQRIRSSIATGIAGRLPDKGEKFRRHLHLLQGERDRRELSSFERKESVESNRRRRDRTPELSVSQNATTSNHSLPEPRPQDSFASLFSKKIEDKAGAECKELRCINRNNGTRLGENEKRLHRGRCQTRMHAQPARMSARESPFRCITSFADRSKKRSSNGDLGTTESCGVSSRLRRKFSGHSPKKKKTLEVRELMHRRSEKAKHVVFLDEEEVQPSPLVHKDAPDEWKEAKVYYPSRDDPESIELSYSDISCLDPEKYLSSPIMNFYMRYLERRVSREGTRGGYYFFNTYFYKKLEEAMSYKEVSKSIFNVCLEVLVSSLINRHMPMQQQQQQQSLYPKLVGACMRLVDVQSSFLTASSFLTVLEDVLVNELFYVHVTILTDSSIAITGDRSACFSKLRRWWKGVNLFQKAYIFLPIHDDLHWSLVIICLPAKENESGPILLHLDSLKLHNSHLVLDIVGNYLKDEWEYINQHDPHLEIPISERIWKNLPRRIERVPIMVPQQKNEYDCGLFVLYYMERFIQEVPERLTKKDISKFDKGWFQPEDASGLIKRIHDLLVEEFENVRFENGRTESPKSSSESPESDREKVGES